jgi:hypothetical protein
MKKLSFALAALVALAACQTKPNRPSVPAPSGQAGQVATLQRVNASAYECWRGDKAFKKYGIVPELDTTGTPRILVIPKGKPQALPQLVITASGRSIQTFGPLATSPLAPRINADVARWAAGGKGCSA